MYDRINSLFLVSGFLNNEDNASQGGNAGLAGVPGQLGQVYSATFAQALSLSKTSIGTLYGGLYQVVQFKSTSSTAPARGGLCFWEAPGSTYVVTPDTTALLETNIAGVYVNAPTKGNYGIIQVGGFASVLFRSSITDTTAGDICVQLTTTNTADAIADATGTWIGGGVKGLKNIIGSCFAAPASSTISTVLLKGIPLNL